MDIRRIPSDLILSNMYLLQEDDHIIIIDPYKNTSLYDNAFCYDYILLTHEHYDHISGVNEWQELTGAEVLCSAPCAKSIESPKRNMSRHFTAFREMQTMIADTSLMEITDYVCRADETFSGEYLLSWQGHELKLLETPGHSVGSIMIFLDSNIMFAGDSLFKDYETELRFPGGSRKKWREVTLPIVARIDKDTLVYPGHFEEFCFRDWIGNSR